jgi:hypothetical protein
MMPGIMSEQRQTVFWTPTRPLHDDGNLLDELRSGIDYLRQTHDAEIEARQRADHLVAGLTSAAPSRGSSKQASKH